MLSLCVPLLMITAVPTQNAEQAMLPSGMDLLYSDRVFFRPWGEPVISIGVLEGESEVVVRSESDLVMDFYEQGILKRSTIAANTKLRISIVRSQPATRRYYVDLEGAPWGDTKAVARALELWRSRGYTDLDVVEEGTVLGIGGYTLDNREYRITLNAKSYSDAERLLTQIYNKFGNRASVQSRLSERPWGELRITHSRGPIGKATSFVRFNATDKGEVRVGSKQQKERRYPQEIYVVVDAAGKLAAVNVVGAERVIEGVVPSETFATAPEQALRAQAVAARNILFSKLSRRHHADPFHLCDEQHCQVYTGTGGKHPATTKAVTDTTGHALFYDGTLVDAVYSATCGGHTENNETVWGDKPNPALRGRADINLDAHPELSTFSDGIDSHELADWLSARPATYCSLATKSRSHKFRWRKSFKRAELNALVARKYPTLGTITDMEVTDRGRGGRAMTLKISGVKSSVTVIHELPIRRLFGNLNSGAFVLEQQWDPQGFLAQVTFIGGGWGHGSGMCQMGAIGRAEAGHPYEKILGHYYNGAEVVRLYDERPRRASAVRDQN
jgi:SpoIID/LytB domain protein